MSKKRNSKKKEKKNRKNPQAKCRGKKATPSREIASRNRLRWFRRLLLAKEATGLFKWFSGCEIEPWMWIPTIVEALRSIPDFLL